MSDILIRDLPDDVVAEIDASAARLGISTDEYVRRQLVRESRRAKQPVTVDDLRRSHELLSSLRDRGLMDQAWR
jgi:plasmid stability protein